MIKLSDRLQMMAELIQKGQTVADIGTDHGFLPVYLWECKKSPRVILADISNGSLQKAVENVNSMNLSAEMRECFEFRLGDGISILENGEVDAITIAGMGGILMTEILGEDIQKTRSFKNIVLQPRNGQGKLRWWLEKNGFFITDEKLVREGKYICEIIRIENDITNPSKNANIPLFSGDETSIEEDVFLGKYEFPEKLYISNGKLAAEFLNRKLEKEIKILDSLNRADIKDEYRIRITKERISYFNYLKEKKFDL